jgi:formyltetrahydrofolate-dependent phosphoribosylglycinamide formyltransferase
MFDKLQQKWNVNGQRLLLILITFAIGGSLTGYVGKKVMSLLEIETVAIYIPVYVLVVTVIWPFMVLLVSIPFRQFQFFKMYISKLLAKLGGSGSSRQLAPGSRQVNKGNKNGVTDSEPFVGSKSRVLPDHKIAIFASGAGTNAQQIINHFRNHEYISVSLVVCNNPAAGVLHIAAAENIPLLLIDKETFFRGDSYLHRLTEKGITFLVLAGFLWKIPQPLIDAFPKRIINIHPALLPKYGGKGMYGQNVHKSVIESGDKESGITIHYVDEHYDNGAVIFQARCAVLTGDTPQNLAERIHALEHAHFPKVIEETLSIA